RSDARIPVEVRTPSIAPAEGRVPPVPFQSIGGPHSLAPLMGAYDSLLERVMPPSLLLSDRGELVHAVANAGRFLRHRDGRQGLDVVDLVDAELKLVLVGSLKRALGEQGPIVYSNVRLADSDGERLYKITVQKLANRSSGAPYLLVSFEATADRPSTVAMPVEIDNATRDQLRVL